MLAAFAQLSSSIITLLEFIVNGEGTFSCVVETDGGEYLRSVGVALLVLFMFLGLLLTNILIAQLAKRFDECWEAQEVNYMYIRVQRLLDAEYLPALPPPFTLLSWPFWTWNLLRWLPAKLAKPQLVTPHTATFMQGRLANRQGTRDVTSGFVIWKDSVTVAASQPT